MLFDKGTIFSVSVNQAGLGNNVPLLVRLPLRFRLTGFRNTVTLTQDLRNLGCKPFC